jgi:FkbM family methyltransferase
MPRKFDRVEFVLGLALVAAIGWAVGNAHTPRLVLAHLWDHPDETGLFDDLQRRFGPTHYSESIEEWIVRDALADRRDGVFVDVGAWEWRDSSNTYYLEHALGWSGLAVDALPGLAAGWRQNRPRTHFVQAFVDDTNGESRVLHVVPAHPKVSSFDRRFSSFFGQPSEEVRVMSATLDRLLDEAGIHAVDFLSMDIETGEPAALGGFSIERYRPRLVCVEAMIPVRQAILRYFAEHRYVVVGKYLRIDSRNLWFEPLHAVGPEHTRGSATGAATAQ